MCAAPQCIILQGGKERKGVQTRKSCWSVHVSCNRFSFVFFLESNRIADCKTYETSSNSFVEVLKCFQ